MFSQVLKVYKLRVDIGWKDAQGGWKDEGRVWRRKQEQSIRGLIEESQNMRSQN